MVQKVEYRFNNTEYRVKTQKEWGEWQNVSIIEDSDLFIHCQNDVISKFLTLQEFAQRYAIFYSNLIFFKTQRDNGENLENCEKEIKECSEKLNELENYWKVILGITKKEIPEFTVKDQMLLFSYTNHKSYEKWDSVQKYFMNRILQRYIPSECPFLIKLKNEFPYTYTAIMAGIDHNHIKIINDHLDFNESTTNIAWLFKFTGCTLHAKEIFPNLLSKGKTIDEGTFNNTFYASKEPKTWNKNKQKYTL